MANWATFLYKFHFNTVSYKLSCKISTCVISSIYRDVPKYFYFYYLYTKHINMQNKKKLRTILPQLQERKRDKMDFGYTSLRRWTF